MFKGHGGTGQTDGGEYGISPAEMIDVSASLSPYGPPEAAKTAYVASVEQICHYPEISADSLRQAYATKKGLNPEQVLAGSGSSEFIYLCVQALCPAAVKAFVPTYSDYADAARVAGIPFKPLRTTFESGFARQLGRYAGECSPGEMIFICNPNNPTGNYISSSLILNIVADNPEVTFVIDEAYADFIGPGATVASLDMPENLLVLQSPTKFYTIPGLRLGYCLAHPLLTEKLFDAKNPWTVSAPAIAVGHALLSCNEYDTKTRDDLAEAKGHLTRLLAQHTDLWVCPGEANFVLCRIQSESPTAGDLRTRCLQRGVAIRDCSNFDGLDSHYIRLAVRTPSENEMVVAALAAGLSES